MDFFDTKWWSCYDSRFDAMKLQYYSLGLSWSLSGSWTLFLPIIKKHSSGMRTTRFCGSGGNGLRLPPPDTQPPLYPTFLSNGHGTRDKPPPQKLRWWVVINIDIEQGRIQDSPYKLAKPFNTWFWECVQYTANTPVDPQIMKIASHKKFEWGKHREIII